MTVEAAPLGSGKVANSEPLVGCAAVGAATWTDMAMIAAAASASGLGKRQAVS